MRVGEEEGDTKKAPFFPTNGGVHGDSVWKFALTANWSENASCIATFGRLHGAY